MTLRVVHECDFHGQLVIDLPLDAESSELAAAAPLKVSSGVSLAWEGLTGGPGLYVFLYKRVCCRCAVVVVCVDHGAPLDLEFAGTCGSTQWLRLRMPT